MAANMRRRSALIVVGMLLLALLVILRFSGKSAKAEEPAEDALRPVAVALVKRRPVVNSLTLSGAFRPYQQVDVHAKVAGFIRKIYVDVGDHVKAGQVLAILEVPELSAQVAGAKADIQRYQDAVRRSESEIQRAESTHAAYHAAYSRLKQASESRPGLIAEQELDDSMAKDKETEPRSKALARRWPSPRANWCQRGQTSTDCQRSKHIPTSPPRSPELSPSAMRIPEH